MQEKIRVVVVVSGGNVQDVLASKEIDLEVIDFDNDPELEEELKEISKELKSIY